jgi:GTPase SAR1 family protein/WD40 repeat protein
MRVPKGHQIPGQEPPASSASLAQRRTAVYQPWSQSQVRVADSWPTRRGQPVSVALSPAGDRLALSVGQKLSVSALSDRSCSAPLLQLACALAPGLTWSPGGEKLAYRDEDGQGRLVDLSGRIPANGESVPANGDAAQAETFGMTSAMAFAPDGDRLATLSPSLPDRMTLTVLRPGQEAVWERVLTRDRKSAHRSEGVNLAWSPDGRFLACTIGTSTVWLIDADNGQPVGQTDNHSLPVTGLNWVDDDWLLSASEDATLQLWHQDGSLPSTVVETISAAGMVFVREQGSALIWSAEGELFAWSLADVPTQLWHRNPPSRNVAAHFTRLAVSAANNLMALVDPGATELILVSDWDRTPNAPAATTTYANAKVLLLGDSGVGKSALAMVLADEAFQPTESTHGRRIWRLPATEEPDTFGDDREVLVWDLAGQPGYRIVHQLHLGDAAVALILFDSRSETSPLAGVRHWARAVRHAHPVTAGGLITFLVAARTDRGGITVSTERRQQVMAYFALDDYFETSAKEGTGVELLRSRLLAAIDWDQLPKITSTALFAEAKRFVVEQKSSGNLLTPLDELSRAFQTAVPGGPELLKAELQIPDLSDADAQEASSAGLTAVFEGCVARLESAGLVKRLKFWDSVLLQPELLDVYASAIVNAARDEPDGLGSILETKVVERDFPIPSTERLLAERHEQLLVFATLEELIRAELVLREPTKDGMQLVFPSASRRDLPPSEGPKGDGVVFKFEGPIDNVYATLVVRLTRSERFTKIATWQSAARFAADKGECTVFLKTDGEGKAELWIGYDQVPDYLRLQFERFVHTHLDRRATAGTVTRERQYSCPVDNTAFTPEQVERARNRGRDSILCPVCENRVLLRDDYQPAADADQSTAAMDASADVGRNEAAASTVLQGKETVAEFDVFLCHNWKDKPAVRRLAQDLRERGIRPWLDENELPPGLPWQRVLEGQIQNISAAIVVVGSQVGPWQDQEMEAFLRQFVKRRCPVIPVLLPHTDPPDLPPLLDGMTWVNLGVDIPDPYDQLVWGITGRRPGVDASETSDGPKTTT